MKTIHLFIRGYKVDIYSYKVVKMADEFFSNQDSSTSNFYKREREREREHRRTLNILFIIFIIYLFTIINKNLLFVIYFFY